jgi:hypothetical protein
VFGRRPPQETATFHRSLAATGAQIPRCLSQQAGVVKRIAEIEK